MFKTFAPAAIAAIAAARGTGTGTDRENATETPLIVDKNGANLTLFTYNADNAGTNEFHGDLTLTIAGDATNRFTRYQEFGFCLQFSATEAADVTNKWDCMTVRTSVDPNEINSADEATKSIYNTDFDITDGYWESNSLWTVTGLTNDTNWATKDDAAKNWRSIGTKSSKACEWVAVGSTVKCTGINAHWYRNFETDSAEQDVQLTTTDPSVELKVLGFRTQYATNDFKPSNTQPAYVTSATIKTVKPVKQAYLDAKAAAAAAVKDGATSLTTYAAAIVAAVYALAF